MKLSANNRMVDSRATQTSRLLSSEKRRDRILFLSDLSLIFPCTRTVDIFFRRQIERKEEEEEEKQLVSATWQGAFSIDITLSSHPSLALSSVGGESSKRV